MNTDVRRKSIVVIPLSVLISVFICALVSNDTLYVIAPMLASVNLTIILWVVLWDREGVAPLFDIGVICVLATLVYTVYPLLNYLMDGLQFGPRSDFRLRQYHITPAELGEFHLRHLLYLSCLVAGYLAFRGRSLIQQNVTEPSQTAISFIVVGFFSLSAYFVLLQAVTGFNYNASYSSGEHAANEEAFARLPLIVAQISGKLAGLHFMLKLATLQLVVSRCRNRRWLLILVLWLIAEVIQTVAVKGARTGLVMILVAAGLLYHRMIRSISLKTFLIASGALMALFLTLGVYRGYTDYASFNADVSVDSQGVVFASGNEFQALLGTAYDVLMRKQAGTTLPWYLYINEFINVLPPQQLLPFEKIPASEWYLRELDLGGRGIGLMWGVVTQAIVGFDWLELAIRGALLGLILAWGHRLYQRHGSSFLATLTYLYFCLRVYYTFRDATFSLITDVIWLVLPFYLAMRFGFKWPTESSKSATERSLANSRAAYSRRSQTHAVSTFRAP